MLSTGIKSPVGLKILGPDLDVIQDLGRQIEPILSRLPGARSAYAERAADGYFVDIDINRESVARNGLTVQEVQDVVRAAIGGSSAGVLVEGRERYPISVRYQYDYRSDLPALERVRIKTPGGAQVALGDLAAIRLRSGPAMIRNENGLLAGYVYVDVGGRDSGGFVEKAQQAIENGLTLPVGYRLEWSGQYEGQRRASARLQLIVPIVAGAIFLLLYFTFYSIAEASAVMLSVVYAMTGGVVLQWLLGYHFSVAVWVGYIALYGVAVQTGVIMVIYLREALDRRLSTGAPLTEHDVIEATVAGAVLRLRPKLMTVLATISGLLPILWSTGAGSDVLKPIAAPIIGGMVTSAMHVLVITPVLFALATLKKRTPNSS
jgi:Cu(I)/Ag(I) efflux system membrane protein CusA/SilA